MLSWSLLAAITDNTVIQNALFPPLGANPSAKKGRRNLKTDHSWKICKDVFADDTEYGAVFKTAADSNDADQQKKWTNKIKNRLTQYVFLCHGCLSSHS